MGFIFTRPLWNTDRVLRNKPVELRSNLVSPASPFTGKGGSGQLAVL